MARYVNTYAVEFGAACQLNGQRVRKRSRFQAQVASFLQIAGRLGRAVGSEQSSLRYVGDVAGLLPAVELIGRLVVEEIAVSRLELAAAIVNIVAGLALKENIELNSFIREAVVKTTDQQRIGVADHDALGFVGVISCRAVAGTVGPLLVGVVKRIAVGLIYPGILNAEESADGLPFDGTVKKTTLDNLAVEVQNFVAVGRQVERRVPFESARQVFGVQHKLPAFVFQRTDVAELAAKARCARHVYVKQQVAGIFGIIVDLAR